VCSSATPATPATPNRDLWGKQRCVFCLNKVKVNVDSEMSKIGLSGLAGLAGVSLQ